jgi:hypothetical protein
LELNREQRNKTILELIQKDPSCFRTAARANKRKATTTTTCACATNQCISVRARVRAMDADFRKLHRSHTLFSTPTTNHTSRNIVPVDGAGRPVDPFAVVVDVRTMEATILRQP